MFHQDPDILGQSFHSTPWPVRDTIMANPHSIVDAARYLTERASHVYESIEFKTDGIYNEPAPDEWIAFLIGGIFSAIGFVLYVFRYRKITKALDTSKGAVTRAVRFRAVISAFIDNDDAFYTITKLASQSFLFLGGLQYNYELTFSVMLGWFAIESSCDSLRVLTAFGETDSIKHLMLASSNIRSKLRNPTTQLRPTNVYEDVSRGKIIVTMVFVTQILLIAFVVVDLYDSATHSCHDGTAGCPVVGTLGSWCFYCLGIFMASVFLLGPKTSFGQSEQNPSFWIQLLISAKRTGSSVTWYDPVKDEVCTQQLSPDDWRVWFRFLMSFLINGVGFHILVHALPIQVATQSSLTGVVFRAVGMLYLVDLDDTPGYTLTVVEKTNANETEDNSVPEKEESTGTDAMADVMLSAQAQAIIDDAHAQLNDLAAGKGTQIGGGGINLTGALIMAGGAGIVAGANGGTTDGEIENMPGEEGAIDDDGGAA